MIHLTNMTRQHGARSLFQNASFQITPGSRSGLVGPNGAGKSTIFRLITGEEPLDGGEISCSKKTVIGYFSQDVGEMSGRSALAEVMAASSRTMQLGEEIKRMEAAMCEPLADDALATLLEKYGDAQEEFEHRGGYDLENRAQAVLTGLGIGSEDYLRPVESVSGGWKMLIALA
jgi:ATP-binding cassette subfamily F protein 3